MDVFSLRTDTREIIEAVKQLFPYPTHLDSGALGVG